MKENDTYVFILPKGIVILGGDINYSNLGYSAIFSLLVIIIVLSIFGDSSGDCLIIKVFRGLFKRR